MASVRVTPRVRPQARQSAVRFRQPGPRAGVRSPAPEPPSPRRTSHSDKHGVLPILEQPENFKDSSKCDIWVVAEKIVTPDADTSAVDPNCHHCGRALDTTRSSLPGGWLYYCPGCAEERNNARSWVDALWSAILNLQQAFSSTESFHHREEISTYVDVHWRTLCGNRPRTATWWKTVLTTLTAHPHLFRPCSVTDRIGMGAGSSTWTIIEPEAPAAQASPSSHSSPRSRRTAKSAPLAPLATPPSSPFVRAAGTPSMRRIPIEDEDEIELRMPIIQRSYKRSDAPRTSSPIAKRTTTSGSSGMATRTLIQRAHMRMSEERKSRSRTGLVSERGCHHCRIVRAGLWRCNNVGDGTRSCARKFCTKCVEKYEPTPIDAEDTWTCLVCRGVCGCARCQHDAVVGVQIPLMRRKSDKRSHHKDKREHKKRRTSDYDITKVVYHGQPLENVRIAPVAAKEIVIPTWRPSEVTTRSAAPPASPAAASPRKRSHKKQTGGSPRSPRSKTQPHQPPPTGSEESDGEEENTDDDEFEARHKRAADRLRNELYPNKDPAITRV